MDEEQNNNGMTGGYFIEKRQKKGADRKTKIFRAIYIPIMVALAGAAGYFYWQGENIKTVTTTTIPTTELQNNASDDNVATTTNDEVTTSIAPIVDVGVTWIEPKEIPNPSILDNSKDGDLYLDEAKYYEVATLEGGGRIILVNASYAMTNPAFLRFRQDASGKYHYLLKNSSITESDTVMKWLKNSDIDYTTAYGALSSPDVISGATGEAFQKGWNEALFSTLTNSKKLTTTAYGTMYETADVEDPQSPSVVTRIFYLYHADKTVTSYVYTEPFMSDNNVPRFTFSDGTVNKDSYVKHLSAACGLRGGNSIIADAKTAASLLKVSGTASNGDKIYGFKDTSSVVFQSLYNFYKVGRDKDVVTIDQFFAKNPITVWKDSFGDYNLYLNSNYGAMAECGKPVVYLYPEKEQSVNVKVGAEIVKSEPFYKDGWTVTAKPNGELSLDGKVFSYLFWEGQGNGVYPIASSGFIVKKEDISATLRDHLAKLGLNKKETDDFMDFWLLKMPNTPYVRLTWFGTEEMNRLAPLSINPKPDTMIRIFLDFKGIDQPYAINPQKLTSKARIGFTVVEWGGLLIK